jgi:hypothetical protein
MADVQAPGVWATFHSDGAAVGEAPPTRVRVLEVVNTDPDDPRPDYVIVASEQGHQYQIPLADGWFDDAAGPLPATLRAAPPGP